MSWTDQHDSASWITSKMKEKVEKHKFKGTASLPTSPASGSRLDPMSSLDGKKRKLTNPQSPPGTPTTLGMDRKDSLKHKLSRTHSGKKHSIGGTIIEEGHTSAFEKAMASLRRNNFAHDSFRLRMFKEQYGFEPVENQEVFMTKKRNRETANTNLSEFKGCDLNKYTSSTYAIQNGNEVFGDPPSPGTDCFTAPTFNPAVTPLTTRLPPIKLHYQQLKRKKNKKRSAEHFESSSSSHFQTGGGYSPTENNQHNTKKKTRSADSETFENRNDSKHRSAHHQV